MIWEINRHGCGLPYDDGIDYVLPCLITGSDNMYYEAVQANGPSSTIQDPVTDTSNTYWSMYAGSAEIQAASTTEAGIIEIADNTETDAGTDNTRAITPAQLHRIVRNASATLRGIIEIAINSEVDTGTDNQRAITPFQLKRISDAIYAALAPINNPVFTGNPRGVTQPRSNNSISLATTAYVERAISDIGLDVTLPTIINMSGEVGTAVDVILAAASGAFWPFDYTVSNLPSGLMFDASQRQITGSPTTQQSRSVTYSVTDNKTNQDSTSFTWTIAAQTTVRYLWFLDNTTNIARAYLASTLARDASKDISLDDFPWGSAASDGTTIWFRRSSNAIAYTAATQSRDSSKDIFTGTGGQASACDGTTVWFVDESTTAHAFVASTQAADSTKDINTGGILIRGATSDGQTIWFYDHNNLDAKGYNATTRLRVSARDIDFDTGTLSTGGTNDGITLWVITDGNQAEGYNISTKTRDSSKDINLGTGSFTAAVSAFA